ncbi:Integrin beta-like protein 1 [Bagarius yarrelli]|uniref:Integrin beta-like protein 1 n=1 Tax=Bagarius yarrelli TaxID=175774 RepID=A0A556V4L9_BAGYA|nr:Integrin beta-like protein 1 [Bagarius yarrelli]
MSHSSLGVLRCCFSPPEQLSDTPSTRGRQDKLQPLWTKRVDAVDSDAHTVPPSSHGTCDCGKCVCDDDWFGQACQYQENCKLSKRKSKDLCRNTQGVVCSNAGMCHCGSCICNNPEGNDLISGHYCECDDSLCLDEDSGEVCGGHGMCYCGNCYCSAGWHGDKCEFQCDISPWESKRRCTSPDGKICSNRDPSGDWGDIHGNTCECDERSCHATYDRYSDEFCSGQCTCGQCMCHPPGDSRVHGKNCECDDRQCEDLNKDICGGHGFCSCGRCICSDGWFGKHCQFPRSCNVTDEQSKNLCETGHGAMCSGKGSCHCGRCICSPQEWYISGDFCECDDRECDQHDGMICTGNGMCNCGTCECWDGWTGNACEIWVGEEY